MSVLGGRIKYLREKRGWTQKEAAEKLGVSVVTWSRYETNDRKPEPETLASIANVFETTTDYLLGRTSTQKVVLTGKDVDPEISELLEKLQQKGAELEATAILRTAAKMNKEQLKDILKVFEMIEKDE